MNLAQRLRVVSASWPTDPFRPNLQLKVFLESLSEHPGLTPHAVKAAEALHNNEVQKKFPLSKRLSRPASMPFYYDRLVEGFEKSSKGVGRPWWKIFLGKW